MENRRGLIIAVLAAWMSAAVGWGALVMYASPNNVPEGVTAGGVAIGGMPVDHALKKLDLTWDSLESGSVAVESANGRTVRWKRSELGYGIARDEALIAIRRLREGSVWKRARYRYAFPKQLRAEQSWGKKTFVAAVRREWSWLESGRPTNATRTITEDDRVVYQSHTVAYRVDYDALFAAAVKATEASADSTSLSEGGRHESGREPEVEVEVRPIKLKLPMETVKPDITLERLKAEGVERKIMTFTTKLGSSAAGRLHNVEVTARTLNDWTLAPGETFDYSKVVRAVQIKYGYREAPVILNGKLVPGIGGGICQVSTTLYNVVLRAGLEIVERRNHSLPVSYVPIGQDATFAEGAINFQFKNTTGKHIVIRSGVEGRQLTVKLFGTMPANVRYEIESRTVKLLEPPVKQISDEFAPSGGQKVLQAGKAGYIVETYRTLVRDGKAVKRERVSRDTYRPTPIVVLVGGARPDSGAAKDGDNSGGVDGGGGVNKTPLLEDGVKARN
ncbi:van Willebrand factor A [Paenibacillus darwinianus]|uniref:Van Willebrand factor A n=1 Tax=Paenibacillus darwinianus TaxID=1380763 RepID=A0A9W5S191_9BACL|nr:VanW family protein [Paenibacillus darwinianus]EXX88219.1 van Willebrand factor A [Paenibacillus darwinianus]EXX88994.1 van Willebrand factor A [Paenibacillus darwinianus]EXX89381.1 van Willebrand factor A [Paenibacillus darwinianus]